MQIAAEIIPVLDSTMTEKPDGPGPYVDEAMARLKADGRTTVAFGHFTLGLYSRLPDGTMAAIDELSKMILTPLTGTLRITVETRALMSLVNLALERVADFSAAAS